MASRNGESPQSGPLELKDVLVIKTTDDQERDFEVVGLIQDEEKNSYAVCYCEASDEFVVTDSGGELITDEDLAQEILDDFTAFAEEAAPPKEG
ncbi:MAG: hypothetical protein JOZ59_03225 [Candidatus Eremiobacteraeota bacterium]|nr:hypothetical protein [Candidatus Eremiobacteraeota bacterium]MBV9278197.1 hypothetical protein [Candidatus Eremiobacteraeota bacterium]